MRVGDYVSLAHNAVQIAVLVVALLSPSIYRNARHWLLFAVSASVVVGAALSVTWTPTDMLPSTGAACLSRAQGRTMVAYLVWKLIFLLPVSWIRKITTSVLPAPTNDIILQQSLLVETGPGGLWTGTKTVKLHKYTCIQSLLRDDAGDLPSYME